MSLMLYNSLTRKKEIFEPIEPGIVKMYVCGMTVYSDVHIGHARTYLAFDIIRRYFEYEGFKVNYIQNITDVDDKIINAANKERVDPLKYSERFANKCLEDLDKLGIRRAGDYPKASENINEMISMIQQILERGFGYIVDGDVYFSVKKFKDYGKLSGQNVDEMKSGARIEPGEKKQSPLDFALWKQAKEGEPSWDSPWGKGRPGWHIECSTMSANNLGLPFDIHGGGMDLRFPHHENEIAQAEAATGKQFAKYWMHIGLLTVDGEKMSKSLGNIVNVKDLLKRWNPEVLRMFFAQAHYRSPPDFSEEALIKVKKSLERIYRLKEKLEGLSENIDILDENNLSKEEKKYLTTVEDFEKNFKESMDDDFNTPKAFAAIFDFVNNSNRFFDINQQINAALSKIALNSLIKICNVLTLFQEKYRKQQSDANIKKLKELVIQYKIEPKNNVEENIKTLLEIREQARMDKNWEKADEIRKKLLEIGFEVQDTIDGPVWMKKMVA